MLHPHEIKATKLRATFNKLIKKYPDPSSSEHIALVKLINEFSVLGFPIFVQAVEGVLNTKGVQEFISLALRAVLKRACSETQSDGPEIEQVYGIAEEEHLLNQLKELVEETKLLHAFKDLSDIERLRSSLWIVATPWLLKKAHDERNQRLRCLLINASDQMGMSLRVNAELYEDECFDILSGILRDCYLAGGELDLSSLSDQTRYLLDDLRGLDQIENLSLPSRGLSYLLERLIFGLDRVQKIEIKGISDRDVALLNEHSDQDYVQGIVRSLFKGVQTKSEHGLECPAKISDKIADSQYKDDLVFLAQRVFYQTLSYELNGVSFNLNYIPHPDQEYWMMETQVTQALYRAVTGESPSKFGGDQLPVEFVSWRDGIVFCNALSKKLGLKPAYKGTNHHCKLIRSANGFRLPFVAEWAFAAKAGQSFKYAGSDNLKEVGWYNGRFGGKVTNGQTQPVAQLKPNGYGLYDMSGNVWEWCADNYDNTVASLRAVCGGSYGSSKYDVYGCEVSSSERFGPELRRYDLGLRLCRSLG